MWDADQYLKYSDERARPFIDLVTRITRTSASSIVDLGCGTGHLTRTLTERWPTARVIGVDNSEAMLRQAQPLAMADRLQFVLGDITSWSPSGPLDLIVSNAVLQWVGDHGHLLSRFRGLLARGGTLAVQMPYQFQSPAYLAIDETKADPRWSDRLRGVGLDQRSVAPLSWYVERLHDLEFTVDAWQTTYLHVLTGDDPVLEWYKGTALRPLLQALPPEHLHEFLQQLAARLRAAYPARNGVTLMPFPRLFFVATLP